MQFTAEDCLLQVFSEPAHYLTEPDYRPTSGDTNDANAKNSRFARPLAKTLGAALTVAGVVITTLVAAEQLQDGGRWVGTWTASPQQAAAPIQINAQTLRQTVHTSIGGERVRVRVSNAYGVSDLVIGSAHVALSAGGSAILQRTDRTLGFNGCRQSPSPLERSRSAMP